MKIVGTELATKNRKIVTLVRGEDKIDLLVSPLTNGFMFRLRALGIAVYPNPPMVAKKLPSGRAIRSKDRDIEFEVNENDSTYIAETAKVTQRIRALQIREHLADETKIQWDAKTPTDDDPENWKKYADALALEVAQSGLTDAEVIEIITVGDKLANGFDIEAGVDRFLSETL